ncbi:hypothetical protein Rsub_12956 [Raphidocelis subcapitata]|uniref:Obg-like ATPase 1 n=1 Tax=Raphidocelis subcapitata TaxID=307507 RepID=A0A2V0PS82_9CHLO|nr:hypothetical protein Rsub_12956 [Raphidocelis subcapitata]|eukprot:GBG00186.1 hypothetical protein Rsub_12956 [Raphidocelis subcapitata]
MLARVLQRSPAVAPPRPTPQELAARLDRTRAKNRAAQQRFRARQRAEVGELKQRQAELEGELRLAAGDVEGLRRQCDYLRALAKEQLGGGVGGGALWPGSSTAIGALQAGIVGLPNVGKSTLFNAIVENGKAAAANFPFCTIEPNVGMVTVPDSRLAELSKISGSRECLPTTVEFVDIAGLVRGASKGEGLGNKFLANIRETDAICQVVRCFEDDDIVHVSGKGANNPHVQSLRARAAEDGAEVVVVSAKVESELNEMPEEEAKEWLEMLGVKDGGLESLDGGLESLVRATYKTLGLQTYFTTGEKETRAWTIRRGMTAPQAAGVIHTDFEKGFIRAETIGYSDFLKHGGYGGAKEAGALRLEGKEYVVQEGDVLLFRFNV